jgi:choline dehydrogenase
VVLAAGAFGSPQLVMLSGVGPRARLGRLGIAVQHDSPEVGENLQDHLLAPATFRARGTDTLKSAESLPSLLRFLLLKRGMLASNVAEAFASTRSGIAAEAAPDIELLFGPLEWRKEGLEPPQVDAFTVGVILLAPRSRGRVTLKSVDPLDPPSIDFGFLSDAGARDGATLLAAVRLARKIAATRPLADYADGELFPGADAVTDDRLLTVLGQKLQTIYHPTSTCRMGTDARSVVDPQLRMRGVEGLWVADASVMPSVPRGHPNAVVAMIANRAADWIRSSMAA